LYYLVQRLIRKDNPRDEPSPFAPTRTADRRFNDIFGCDYMGSSEFEFGAVPRAYRQMLKFDMSIRPVELISHDVTRTVYFIASDDPVAYQGCWHEIAHGNDGHITCFEQAIEAFKQWLSTGLRAKEQTYFDMLFEDKFPDYMRDHRPQVDAWWSLDDNIVWTLDENIAQELLEVFNVEPLPAPGDVIVEVSAEERVEVVKKRKLGSSTYQAPAVYIVTDEGRTRLPYYEHVTVEGHELEGDHHLKLRYDSSGNDRVFVERFVTEANVLRYDINLDHGQQYVLGLFEARKRKQPATA
jgi:hypothetical protein